VFQGKDRNRQQAEQDVDQIGAKSNAEEKKKNQKTVDEAAGLMGAGKGKKMKKKSEEPMIPAAS